MTYALGIYYLNLFIAFLSPKSDPAMDFEGNNKFKFREISILYTYIHIRISTQMIKVFD